MGRLRPRDGKRLVEAHTPMPTLKLKHKPTCRLGKAFLSVLKSLTSNKIPKQCGQSQRYTAEHRLLNGKKNYVCNLTCR